MRVYINSLNDCCYGLAKKLGADYVEDDCMFFKMPKKIGASRAAICVDKSLKEFCLGVIVPECDNFSEYGAAYDIRELDWIIATLNKIKNYKTIKASLKKVKHSKW